MKAEHDRAGHFYLYAEPTATLLFCENETNEPRISGAAATTNFPKDGIGDHLIRGADTVNPADEGTKVRSHLRLDVPAEGKRISS